VKLPFLPPPKPRLSPYCEGYLTAHSTGITQINGGIVPMPARVYGEGSDAQAAFIAGISDSIKDREPRKPYHRVSRAYPPWRQI
jgi:hypothetical protein